MYTYKHTYKHMHARRHKYIYMQAGKHTCTYINTHKPTYTFTHTYIQSYIHRERGGGGGDKCHPPPSLPTLSLRCIRVFSKSLQRS